MNTKNSLNVKSLVLSGLLTALSIVIPLFMPKLPVPQPFSVTPASHLPIILAMFVSPYTVVCAAIGSFIAYLTLGPIVALRALSHILFALTGYYLLKKNYNLIIVIVVTMLLHAFGEIMVVFAFSLFGMANIMLDFLFTITGGITMLHHCFDFILTLIVYKALKAVPGLTTLSPINLRAFKK